MSVNDLPTAYQKLLDSHLSDSETVEAVHVNADAETDLLALTDRRVLAGGQSTGTDGRASEEMLSIALNKVENAKIEQRGVEPIDVQQLYLGIGAIILGLVSFGAFPALTGSLPTMLTPLSLSIGGLLVATAGVIYVWLVTNTEDEYTRLTIVMENSETLCLDLPADAYDIACQITGAIGNRWS